MILGGFLLGVGNNGFSNTLTPFFFNINLIIIPIIFLVYIIILCLEDKSLLFYKNNKFNFMLEIIFLLWSTTLYIVFFEICIDNLVNTLINEFIFFEYKVQNTIKIIIRLILAFLPILYFLISINNTIRKGK